MRSYSANSPHAVCRLLLLSALIDGSATRLELETTCRDNVLDQGCIEEKTFDEVLQEMCSDLKTTSDGLIRIETIAVDQLLGEILDHKLRVNVWKAMWKVAYVDGKLADAELALLLRATSAWSIEAESRDGVSPALFLSRR